MITDSSGNVAATGAYTFKYYRIDPPIGELYTNGEAFRSTEAFCDGLLRQAGGAGAAWVAYAPANGYGTCTINQADVEKDSWLLSDYELILYSALSVASEYLGNDEDVARYTRLYLEKLSAMNARASTAELKGANVAMTLQINQGL